MVNCVQYMINLTSNYILYITYNTAANLTTNTEGEACQGEVWVLTCTGHTPTHRWTLEIEGSIPTVVTYIASHSVPGIMHRGSYNFTLISATNNWFESSVSTALTAEINNTVAKCTDIESEEKQAIRITGSVVKIRQS